MILFPEKTGQPNRARLDSIDLLRGVVMVLMAIDHVRDFWGPTAFLPEDLSRSTPGLFFTRWITHFCAPIFVFLAGTGAYLFGARGRTRGAVSRFLLTRGVWLIVLEFTVVQLGWSFTYHNGWAGGPYTLLFFQVIWVIGVSMIVLAGLIHLPIALIGAIGIAMIGGHNLLDSYAPDAEHWFANVWKILHVGQQPVRLTASVTGWIIYPLIPWIGVMAAGYAFGAVASLDASRRRRWFFAIGLVATFLFVALRWSNAYGDPRAWSAEPPCRSAVASVPGMGQVPSVAEQSAVFGLMSFLNCEKYPPSLLFLLMTLGPAILALAFLESARGPLAKLFVIFGRVPLFYYVLHIPLANVSAAVYFQIRFGEDRWLAAIMRPPPDGFEVNLGIVYAAWAGVVLLLLPLCAWYAGMKKRHRSWWLSYL